MLSYIFFLVPILLPYHHPLSLYAFHSTSPHFFPLLYVLFLFNLDSFVPSLLILSPFLRVRSLSLCPLSFLILPIFSAVLLLSLQRFQCSYSFPQFLVHDDDTNDSLIEQLLLTYYVFENDGTTCLIKDALLPFQVS